MDSLTMRIFPKYPAASPNDRLKSLAEMMTYHLKDYKIISFDCFDTLLHRTIFPPDMIKIKTATLAIHLLSQQGIDMTETMFQQYRDEEEAALRVKNAKNKLDMETNIDNILDNTLLRINAHNKSAIRNTLIEYELANECRYLYLSPQAKEVLHWVKSQGLKLIVTSDMYFGAQHLLIIFKKFQINHYIDKIYVSSDYYFDAIFNFFIAQEEDYIIDIKKLNLLNLDIPQI